MGFSEEEFIAAVEFARQTRPGRYTILEHLALDKASLEAAYADYAKAVAS
jgi:glycerol-1-phosphate dehydrogenase [NAD(P)+]